MKLIVFAPNRIVARIELLKGRRVANVQVHTPDDGEHRLMGYERDTPYHIMSGYPETDAGLRVARVRYREVTVTEAINIIQQMETKG